MFMYNLTFKILGHKFPNYKIKTRAETFVWDCTQTSQHIIIIIIINLNSKILLTEPNRTGTYIKTRIEPEKSNPIQSNPIQANAQGENAFGSDESIRSNESPNLSTLRRETDGNVRGDGRTHGQITKQRLTVIE